MGEGTKHGNGYRKANPGALTRTGRVQNDQVWVWGATIPRQPERFVFRILEHPEDTGAGRPA